MVLRKRRQPGLSLVELLIVVAVIGIIAAIVLPAIGNLRERAKRLATIQNAKNIAQMSQGLAALGVAHVIPDSMGGVPATARLLREGIMVTEGPMAGERFTLSGMNDSEIEDVAEFLVIQYSETELLLYFLDPEKADGTGLTPFSDRILYAGIREDRPGERRG